MRKFILKIEQSSREMADQAFLAWLGFKLQGKSIPKALKEAPRYFKLMISMALTGLVVDGVFFIYICWQVKTKDVNSWERWGSFYFIVALTFLYGAITWPMLQWRLNHPSRPNRPESGLREMLQWRLNHSTLPNLSEDGREEWRTLSSASIKNLLIWNSGLFGGLALGSFLGLAFIGVGLLSSVLIDACRAIGQRTMGIVGVAVNQHAARSKSAAAVKEREQAHFVRKSISRQQYRENRRQVPQVQRARWAAILGIVLWLVAPILVIIIAVIELAIPALILAPLVITLTALTNWGSKMSTKPLLAKVAYRSKTSYWPNTVQDIRETYVFGIKLQKLSALDSFVAPAIYSALALLMDWALGNKDPLIHFVFQGVWIAIGTLFLSALTAVYASEMGRSDGQGGVTSEMGK